MTKDNSKSGLVEVVSRFGIDSWVELLQIAEEISAPKEQPPDSVGLSSYMVFEHKTGWKVVIFYDCGELDYIDHFVTPDGKDVEFWDLPENDTWKDYLMNWRGTGDLKRLLSE